MKVWLDDERDCPPGWLHVTTANDAIIALRTRKVKKISLDHDLGAPENGTGYDVACFIEQESFTMSMPRIEWAIHSQNAVGIKNMKAALQNADDNWDKWEGLLKRGTK